MNVTASQTLPVTTANSTHAKVCCVTMASRFATTINVTASAIRGFRVYTVKSTTAPVHFALNMDHVNSISSVRPPALAQVVGLAITVKFLIHVNRIDA